MNLPTIDQTAHHSQQWVTLELGLNSTGQGIPRLGRDNRKLHNTTGRISSKEPLTPTTHRISFPTCLSHPRSVHLHCHTSPSTATPPFPRASTTGWIRNSQSSIAATGLPPRDLTSSAHSLTWREFLIGLTTCFFTLTPQHMGKVMEATKIGHGGW
jgi:hypothetical protein